MRLFWLCCCVSFLGVVAAQEDTIKRLQSNLRLPIVGVKISFGFNFEGMKFLTTGNPFAVEIPQELLRQKRDELERQISGDLAKDVPIYREIANLSARLGEDERVKKEWQRMYEILQVLLKKEPKNWKWHLYTVEALRELGKEKEANKLLKETTKRFPKQWQVWMFVGIEEWTRSFTPLVKFMEEETERLRQGELCVDVEVWKSKFGGLLTPLKQSFQKAIPYWQRAHKLAPNEPLPLLALSLAYYSLGVVSLDGKQCEKWQAKAKETIWKAVDKEKTDPFCIVWAIILEGPPSPFEDDESPQLKQRIERAIKRLEQIVKSANQSFLWGLLGLVYAINNRETEAEDCFRKALDLEPNQWIWCEWLYAVRMEQRRYEDALQVVEDWLHRNDFPRARYLAALASEKLDDWEKVETHLKAALEKDEKDLYANLGMIVVELRKGEPQDAVKRAQKYWEKISDLSPSDDDAKLDKQAIYGILCAMSGHLDEARALLREVLQKKHYHPLAKVASSILDGK